jgi:predicted transcriptional regulator
MQENKGQNHPPIGGPIDQSFWRTIGLISGDEHFFYVLKKTEKIVTALYLVTNLIKDNDPLKWEIRERCMSLISSTVALASIDSQEKNTFMRFFLSSILETRTFVNISLGSHIISKMNAELIIDEIDALVIHIKDRAMDDASRAGYVLSKSFFATESPSRTDDKGQVKTDERKPPTSFSGKINQSVSFRNMPKNNTSIKDSSKDSRKTSIIELLKKQPHQTIKDIVKDIPNCSTKTVQRELSNLVNSGVIKKEGDRRWSRYSLK